MARLQKITPCLWFDHHAEDAAKFYVGIFPNARILRTAYFGEAGHEIHGMEAGTVMTVDFELDGLSFTALNGGPVFKLSEAMSLQVFCATQEELDRYWDQLSAGGDPSAQQCGWLKDKFGLSWQIVPAMVSDMMVDKDPSRTERVMAAMMPMKKLDFAALQRAYDGA